jgi:hypothetical protein
MLSKQVKNFFGTKQEASARQIEECRSHGRRYENRGSRKLRSIHRQHHHHNRSPKNLTKRSHA